LSERITDAGSQIPDVTRTYVNGGVDQVLWSVDGASANFWLNDVNGSVYGITDQTGSIIQRQRYDAYGATEVTQENAGFANRVGFQGRNEIAGFGIQNFRNRFYDPAVGRFLSRDPLGLVDGPAVYGFCGGDPVNRTDPMGTKWHWVPFPPPPHWQWQDDGDGPTPPKVPGGYDITDLPAEITDTYTTPWGEIVAVKDKNEYDAIIAGWNQANQNFRRNKALMSAADAERAQALLNDPTLASNFFRDFSAGFKAHMNTPEAKALRQSAYMLWKTVPGFDIAVGLIEEKLDPGAEGISKAAGPTGIALEMLLNPKKAIAKGALRRGGKTAVYTAEEAGKKIYVGITDDLARRSAEHLRERGFQIVPLLEKLSRHEARAVEQALIEIHGLGDKGGALLNKINSIAKTNPKYAEALKRGYELLKGIGYE
jgi:RHS repeat-associated protein